LRVLDAACQKGAKSRHAMTLCHYKTESFRKAHQMEHAEHCRFDGQLFAIIIRASFREPGITFFSPPKRRSSLPS
jgi:hypothetical protein